VKSAECSTHSVRAGGVQLLGRSRFRRDCSHVVLAISRLARHRECTHPMFFYPSGIAAWMTRY